MPDSASCIIHQQITGILLSLRPFMELISPTPTNMMQHYVESNLEIRGYLQREGVSRENRKEYHPKLQMGLTSAAPDTGASVPPFPIPFPP